MRYAERMNQSDRRILDMNVESIALNNMVGREFDMMDYLVEKASTRNQLIHEWETKNEQHL